ncbi:MAG TPA: response regulator [Sphingomicrobium sp.]
MLFGKRKRIVKRILIVEDEPLTAFDTETILGDLGYEVVATTDDFDAALEHLDRELVHLVVADVRLHGEDLGLELAKSARVKGIPTLLATGHEVPLSASHAVGCLRKPYTERQLKLALETIDRHLQGEKVKPPKGLELFIVVDEQK